MTRWPLLATTLALSGCVSGISGTESERLVGHYSRGFEVEAFRPCGSKAQWWVTAGDELRTRHRALNPAQYQEVFVELRGSAGPVGKFGHMGAYERELQVEEVLVIRMATDRDCG